MILETIVYLGLLAIAITVIGFLSAVIFLTAEMFYEKLKSIIEKINEVEDNE